MTPNVAPSLHLPRALAHLTTRPMGLNDADAALALRRRILQTMPPALRAVDPAQGCLPEVEQAWANTHLGDQARTLGVWDNNTLVALACLLLADAQNPHDPGHTLGLPANEWHRSAHMAVCLVTEDYRGLHLQSKLLKWRREIARANGRNLLLAMTACGNTYSRRNLLAEGMGIHWIGEWRPSSWWYGLVQDLGPAAPGLSDRDHEWVAVGDVPRQRHLLSTGYVAVAEMACHSIERRTEPRLQYVRRNANPLQPRFAAPVVARAMEREQ